jgi:hypothetical protein
VYLQEDLSGAITYDLVLVVYRFEHAGFVKETIIDH